MNRSIVRRAATLFVLSVLLGAPWSAADPQVGAAPPTLLAHIWSRLTGFWSDIGCIIDPNGTCVQADIGCGADPNGGCHDSAASDIGCGIDPNGGCSH